MSLIKSITRKAVNVTGVFFRYPGTKLELELVPWDTSERKATYEQCKIEAPIRGFRQKDVSYDEDMFTDKMVDRVVKSARNCTVGCLKKLMLVDEGALKEQLGLDAITDETPVPLTVEDIKSIVMDSIDVKLWLNSSIGDMDIFNAALKAQSAKNL